jgi:uncharacterized protein (DUF58 family)
MRPPARSAAAEVIRVLATAGLGVGLCLAGAVFDSPSLYVPGLALGALAIGSVVWVRLAAAGARVERAAGPPTVVEEEPWPLRVRVRTGTAAPPGSDLIEPLLGWPVPMAGRRSRRVRINVRFARRGRRLLAPPSLVLRDPLGLHELTLEGDGGDAVLVLPRIEPVEPARGGGGAGEERGFGGADAGLAGRRLDATLAELEIDGLRPYRDGAPASRIHWPTVARTREMVERRLVADLDAAPLVVLDASSPESEEALDKAVRATASLCVHLARAGGCAVLLPRERRPWSIGPDLGGWGQVHARLALVSGDAPPPAVGHLARGGAVFWVTASASPVPARSLERLPAATRWLVSPGPARGGALTVAGCSIRPFERRRRLAAAGGAA